MSQTSHRPALKLSAEEPGRLQSLAGSRTAAVREVQRDKTLLGYAAGHGVSTLSRETGATRRIFYKHVDRALAAGVSVALADRRHGLDPTITTEAKKRVLACAKPKEHGYAAELWTRSALAAHVCPATIIFLH